MEDRVMVKIDRKTDVLLVVDFQNDFITGSLAVTGAENLIPAINKYIGKFRKVVFSRDRHKEGHPSFTNQGGVWPDHCVDGTYGMEIHSDIKFPEDTSAFKGTKLVALIDKGWDEEAYSAFEGTNLADMLKAMGAKRLFVCGLATDYCVKATAIDAAEKFTGEIFLLADAVKAVNLHLVDGTKAMTEMANNGIKIITLGLVE
jgi:nicotinamidase/pyrazinamidase